ncbi:hypothetical protein Lste_3271 [Legionella steelei]|uniref:Uncharacterized protein n=1 Tax=Legionella steelei TaxID=947033 RepID=A0A0W0ZDB6_9GAMM|nr:hypothetical protein [Legionella steelei]KTD67065.1 hypothetical protein Lste_3271 [Legionella steelei]
MAFTKFFQWGDKKVDQLKAGANRVFADKPKIYDTIRDLKVELKAEAKNAHSEDIINALRQLDARLDEIQKKFNAKTSQRMNMIQYMICVRDFATECRSALYSYEPTLMAAPGIGNKLKAYFNRFLEEYLGIEPYFDVEKSTLGLTADFRQQFNQAKTELTPQEDPEDSCMPGLF